MRSTELTNTQTFQVPNEKADTFEIGLVEFFEEATFKRIDGDFWTSFLVTTSCEDFSAIDSFLTNC